MARPDRIPPWIVISVLIMSLLFLLPSVLAENDPAPSLELSEGAAEGSAEGPAEGSAEGPAEGAARSDVSHLAGNISYAMITDERFTPMLKALEELKTSKGVKAEIYELNGTEGILEQYKDRGRDTPEKIHKFLQDLNEANPELEWLLLVGDTEIIPSRLLFMHGEQTTDYSEYCGKERQIAESDVYYSGLVQDWDGNKNGIFGEEGEYDLTLPPDLYVGRLPVNTIEEANRAISNIISYETDPPPGYWYNSHLTMAALMKSPNIDDPGDPLTYKNYKDNAYEVAQKLKEVIPEHMTNYILYDYNQLDPGSYTPYYDKLNRSRAMNYFNLGNSQVTFASHGDANGDALKHYAGDGKLDITDEYFSYEDAQNSKNGQMLPLVYASACAVGNFSERDDTNLERLLYAENGGAIGLISASAESTFRLEYQDGSSFGNWWLVQDFWNEFYSGTHQPGKALYQSKLNYDSWIKSPLNPHKDEPYTTYYKINRLAYNLLGDPEIPIWTDAPRDMDVILPDPFFIHNNTLEVKIKEKNGTPIRDALVCIRANGLYLTGRTDINGHVEFDVEINDTIVMNITATAHNHVRFDDSFNVISINDLVVKKDSIDFDIKHPLEGELVTISAEIQNNGHFPVKNVSIHFYQGSTTGKTIGSFNRDIEEGGVVNISLQWAAEEGTNTIFVVVDPKNSIYEFNENNNQGFIEIRTNKQIVWLSSPPDILMKEDTRLIDHPELIYDLYKYVDDPDGPQPIELRITDVSENINCSLIDLGDDQIGLNIEPPKDYFGNFNIVVTASDGPTSAKTDIRVVVKNVYDEPEFQDIPILKINESEDFNMEIKAFDVDSEVLGFEVDSDELNITWYQISNKSINISLNANNSMVGRHTISIRANDSTNRSAVTELVIDILNVNTKPWIVTPNASKVYEVKIDEEFNLHVQGKDEDKGDLLLYRDDTSIFEINQTSGVISFVPDKDDIGIHRVWVTVVDRNGSTSSIELVLDISDNNVTHSSLGVFAMFVACVIAILAIGMVITKRKRIGMEKERMEKERMGENPSGSKEQEAPSSLSRRNQDIEDVIEEYSVGQRTKRLPPAQKKNLSRKRTKRKRRSS